MSAPAKVPRSGARKPLGFSNAGAIRPSIAAASMTPAANPRTMSLRRCGILLKAIPERTPRTVELPIDMRTMDNMEKSRAMRVLY